MDIYFRPEYGKLCELIDGGISEVFEYKTEHGKVTNLFIKREIPELVNGEKYYDIITPYGYGGPIVSAESDEFIPELCSGYDKTFTEYCKENNIVSEFVRFHPLYNNARDFEEIYHPEHIRNTLGTNLADFDDPVQSEFGKSCRKNIRRALNAGISFSVTRAPENIDEFMEIYYSTMDRDNASEFYYFDKKYFDTILEYFRNELIYTKAIYEDKVIAANICFVTDGNIHIHLSGTLSEYLYLSPAYVLRYAVAMWGKENGLCTIHHGGGTSNSPEDSLYCFKKQFAKNTEFEFYIGKKIRNKEIYNKLCEKAGTPADSSFFPAYRKR